MRPNLRVIYGRQAPVLTQEYRTESLWAVIRRWLYSMAEALFAGIALAAVAWAAAVFFLNLG